MKTGTRFDADLNRILTNLLAKSDNLRTPLSLIGELMRSSVLENFRQEGRPEKWKPSIRAQEEGGQTLTDEGHLKGSIYAIAQRQSLELGSPLVYASVHNFGYPPKNIPQRKFLLFQKEDIEQAKKILRLYLKGEL